MIFKLLYSFFIFSLVFGTSIYFGPLTPRQIFAIIMALYCIVNVKILVRFWNKVLFAYFIFLFIECVSFCLEYRFQIFLREFVSKHLVALVAYFSTILLCKKQGNCRYLFVTLLLCGIINGVVCVFQKMGNITALSLGALFTDLDNESVVTNFEKMVDGTGNYIFGLMGHPVNNGLFMLISFFVTLYFIFKNKSSSLCCIAWGLMLFFYYVIFIIQQRSCLMIATLLMVYYFYRKYSLQKIVIGFICILPILLLLLVSVDIDGLFDGTRYEGRAITEESRFYLYVSSISYIAEHFFIGGIGKFLQTVGNLPHNVILNAFIYSGFLGFIPLMYVYIKNLGLSYKGLKNFDKEIVVSSYALLAISLNSLLHNNSLVSGEVFIWIFWAVIIIRRYGLIRNMYYK